MESTLQRIQDLVAETWRLLRLVSVGVAWSIPLVLSEHLDVNPGLTQPVARFAERIGQFAPYAAPVLALIGICIVVSLSPRVHHRGLVSVVPLLVLLALSLVSTVCLNVPYRLWQPPEWVIPVVSSVAAIAAVLSVPVGFGVTFAVLWRRARWLGPVWLLAWLAAAGFMLRLGQVPDGYPHMGAASGVLLIFRMMTVLLVSVLVACPAYVAMGLRPHADKWVSVGEPI